MDIVSLSRCGNTVCLAIFCNVAVFHRLIGDGHWVSGYKTCIRQVFCFLAILGSVDVSFLPLLHLKSANQGARCDLSALLNEKSVSSSDKMKRQQTLASTLNIRVAL